jgi:hypothetical protein
MSKLTRQDWERLRGRYKVAFTGMRSNVFTTLLDKVYGPRKKGNPGSDSANEGNLDDTDALMVYLAHDMALARSEPGIRPSTPIK